eukprot:1155585-Pelagomonas_calceolata.AAC.1
MLVVSSCIQCVDFSCAQQIAVGHFLGWKADKSRVSPLHHKPKGQESVQNGHGVYVQAWKPVAGQGAALFECLEQATGNTQ